ncbi:lysosomal Pro-X carboxypeptidase-like [Symsagittifera roscoffensis]|uniref:lysosomal Pro-X carboxypeptidase-like n=1 Tax=Symsagittifera roscoffensis TaxID=84072 RepID=UPI00307B602D
MAMKLRSCILATLFVCCFLYITGCGAFKYRPHFIKYRSRGANGGGQRGLQFTAPKTANYKTYYYESKIDKFGFTTEDTFRMRYLINDSFVSPSPNPPIFFYAGNEGDITGFADNTGVMFELGKEVGALIVFAEHRYYGESKVNDNKNFTYLSAELALADYAEFLQWLKTDQGYPDCKNSPVVVFGGSYGGMLASWMRIKYPFLVIGAWAASAPVAWFENLTDCNAYNSKVFRDFAAHGENCPVNILRSWDLLNQSAQTDEGRKKLQEYFDLCDPLTTPESVYSLAYELADAWGSVAMVNYPYPTEFLQPLPAWPVSVMCGYLQEGDLTDDEILQAVANASKVYYNYYDQYPCFNISEGDIGLDANIWGYQACTEMVMPMCSRKGESMFPDSQWSWEEEKKACEDQFQFPPGNFRPYWMVTQYGARQIESASNIIFSNGDLDPWQAGGVSDNLGNPTIYTLSIANSAHHLDLRTSNPLDPDSVKEVRAAEFLIVKGWLKDYYKGYMKQSANKYPV